MAKYKLEYIWLDGYEPVPNLRGKTQIKEFDGFPKLEVADYAELHEMMDVATCGYPFGDFLWNQVGSVTSSFTKGTMSAILPAPGIARAHARSGLHHGREPEDRRDGGGRGARRDTGRAVGDRLPARRGRDRAVRRGGLPAHGAAGTIRELRSGRRPRRGVAATGEEGSSS